MKYNKCLKKIPAYLEVYDRLYEDITEGKYEDGDLLPSENVLSEEYDISRNTLRQALAVLMQDGLIYKIQGKGTFVKRELISKEKIYNFATHGKEDVITRAVMGYQIDEPTVIARKKVDLSENVKVLTTTTDYYRGEIIIAHTYTQVSMDFLQKNNIKHEEYEEVYKLVNDTIYEKAEHSSMIIQCILSNVTEYSMKLEKGTPLLYIEQILVDEDEDAIARKKYYLSIDNYKISVS